MHAGPEIRVAAPHPSCDRAEGKRDVHPRPTLRAATADLQWAEAPLLCPNARELPATERHIGEADLRLDKRGTALLSQKNGHSAGPLLRTLDQEVGVRIPAPQLREKPA
jgi:hypothetical protein